MRGSPYGGKRSSHSTDCGTRRRMLHHVEKVSGSYCSQKRTRQDKFADQQASTHPRARDDATAREKADQ